MAFKILNILLLVVSMCVFSVCVLQNLHKQLEEAIQDGEIWVMQLKDTEYELEGSRERVQQQATEILHKASETDFLSVTVAQYAAVHAHLLPASSKRVLMLLSVMTNPNPPPHLEIQDT